MAGGQVYGQYLISSLETYNAVTVHKQEVYRQAAAQIPNFDQTNPEHQRTMQMTMHKYSYDVGIYTLGGESLLSRGRNHIAQVALTQSWDKLMFIDADAGWTWPQLKKILDSPHPITAGICPLKTYVPPNYDLSLNYLPFSEDEIYFDNALRTPDSTRKMAKAKGSDVFPVAFVGTAFLCINREVLQKLAETAPEYIYPNPHSGQPEVHWAFFDGGPIDDAYFSEDWAFCEAARKIGYDINIDSSVVITHTGNHTFQVK